MKNLLSSNPNRVDPLGDLSQISPASPRKIAEFLEANDDPFADLVISSAKRVVDSKKAKKAKQKASRRPTTPGLAY